MLANEISIPSAFYASFLKEINGIKFSQREIDVIACLLNGRSTKKTASLLGLSPKTIETHMRNIMLKLDCNSRGSILDFIEKSNKYSFIKTYYTNILISYTFEEKLKTISKKIKPPFPSCLIVYWKGMLNDENLVSQLENHLNLVGIKTLVSAKNELHLVDEFSTQSVDHILCFVPDETLDTILNEVTKFNHTLHKNSKKITLLLSQERDDIAKDDNVNVIFYGSILKKENYYAFIKNILNSILPHFEGEMIFSELLKEYKEDLPHLQLTSFPQSPIKEKNEKKENDNILHIAQFVRAQKWMSFIFLFLLGLVCFYVTKGNDGVLSFLLTQKKTEPHFVRSDLVIPTEHVFLSRPELLQQLDHKFKDKKGIHTVALLGPGGAGKTTLARQYAHNQKASIIWEVNAETSETLKNSFDHLAQTLAKSEEDRDRLKRFQQIKNPAEKEEELIHFVKQRLISNSNWFFIFDNVKEFSDIQKYIPQDSLTWGDGRIILTTPDSNIQNNQFINDVVHVNELTPSQKMALFLKIMNTGSSPELTSTQQQDVQQFLNEIPPFPLDISIAAYYLKATKIPYKKYLENLGQHSRDFAGVQESLLKQAGNYTKTRQSIVTLSLENILNAHKDFVDLLLLISLLDSQNIPREILEKNKNNLIVDNFIYNLKKYSLITAESSSTMGPTFSIHRNTQQVILQHLSTHFDLRKGNIPIASMINSLYAYTNQILVNDEMAKMKELISHLSRLLEHKSILNALQIADVEGQLGAIYIYFGYYQQSKNLLEHSLETYKKYKDSDPLKVACVMQGLGTIYRLCGDYALSQNYYEKSLSIFEKHKGNQSREYFTATSYLGAIYEIIGKYKEAKEFIEDAIVFFENNHGKNHGDVAWNLVHLGILHKKTGNYQESIKALNRALEIYKDSRNESVYVGWPLIHLGSVYGRLGDYGNALEKTQKAVDIYKKHYGPQHVVTASGLIKLGNLYKKLGLYSQAQALFKDAYDIYQTQYGTSHTDVALASIHLGNISRLLNDPSKALNLITHGLNLYKEKLGTNHIKTGWAFINLGSVYKDLGDYQKAQEYLEQGFAVYKNHYGMNHNENAAVLRELGEVYLLQGNIKSAENYIHNAVAINKGIQHPEMCLSVELLSELYKMKSQEEEQAGRLQKSKEYKDLALLTLKEIVDLAVTHFPRDSSHIVRIKAKIKRIQDH